MYRTTDSIRPQLKMKGTISDARLGKPVKHQALALELSHIRYLVILAYASLKSMLRVY